MDENVFSYSEFPPCGHLAITDTRILKAQSPAERCDLFGVKLEKLH